MNKEAILLLVHRLPFPPNKGDKIRSYHLLEYLSERYDVHLGCFVDDPDDLQYIGAVEDFCKSTCVPRLGRLSAKIRSLGGFITGSPLSNPYYRNNEFAKWVDKTLADNDISSIVTFSSPMAQYVLGKSYSAYRRIMDFVDIDSDKWLQYANQTKGPMKWIYKRESKLLADYEHRVSEEFDAAIFVSDNETETFAQSCPGTRHSLHTVCNGVAVDYFDPGLEFSSPFPPNSKAIVFTGMMDYWPNVDAVQWFAQAMMPKILERVPDAKFWIVGASPTKKVTQLGSSPGVQVTGKVLDVRPYLRYSDIVVAPLRIARGVQNKVLEALAMNRAVVCTPQAAAGLSNLSDAPIKVADAEDVLIAEVVDALDRPIAGLSSAEPREYVLEHYNWSQNLDVFSKLLAANRIEP